MEIADLALNELAKCKAGADILIWTQSESGSFTTKSAWDCIQVRGSALEGHKWIWNNLLPKKFSIFMWKAWHGALVVDDRIRRIGIPIASKCNCFQHGQYKDHNHILFYGEVAAEVWKKCSCLLGFPTGRTCRETTLSWFQKASNSSQTEVILGILPIIISWKLWGRRCSARIEGKLEYVQVVWLSIKHWLGLISHGITKVKEVTQVDHYILHSLNNLMCPIQQEVQFISWSKPT